MPREHALNLYVYAHVWRDMCISAVVQSLLLGSLGRVVNSFGSAWHCLSPLAAFTSGAYFLPMEGGDSEFANFTLPTLKAFLEACSQNVSGNKQ